MPLIETGSVCTDCHCHGHRQTGRTAVRPLHKSHGRSHANRPYSCTASFGASPYCHCHCHCHWTASCHYLANLGIPLPIYPSLAQQFSSSLFLLSSLVFSFIEQSTLLEFSPFFPVCRAVTATDALQTVLA